MCIVEYIAMSIRNIERAIGWVRRESDLSSQYHARLVADVVTGEFDMRGVTAALPEFGPLVAIDEGELGDGAT